MSYNSVEDLMDDAQGWEGFVEYIRTGPGTSQLIGLSQACQRLLAGDDETEVYAKFNTEGVKWSDGVEEAMNQGDGQGDVETAIRDQAAGELEPYFAPYLELLTEATPDDNGEDDEEDEFDFDNLGEIEQEDTQGINELNEDQQPTPKPSLFGREDPLQQETSEDTEDKLRHAAESTPSPTQDEQKMSPFEEETSEDTVEEIPQSVTESPEMNQTENKPPTLDDLERLLSEVADVVPDRHVQAGLISQLLPSEVDNSLIEEVVGGDVTARRRLSTMLSSSQVQEALENGGRVVAHVKEHPEDEVDRQDWIQFLVDQNDDRPPAFTLEEWEGLANGSYVPTMNKGALKAADNKDVIPVVVCGSRCLIGEWQGNEWVKLHNSFDSAYEGDKRYAAGGGLVERGTITKISTVFKQKYEVRNIASGRNRETIRKVIADSGSQKEITFID